MAVALIDERIDGECERALTDLGYAVVKLSKTEYLSEPLASHTDMLAFVHGGEIIASRVYREEAESVFSDIRALSPATKISFTDEVQGREYPHDAIFNALVMGDTLFCRTDTVSRAVLDYARGAGLRTIHVRQGYPACTVLPLSSRAAITADLGMARALRENEIDVTVISDGDISLPPYAHGFIGGAAGVRGGCVYFLGNLRLHRDADAIEAACRREGLTPVSLGGGVLRDLGRIVFLD